MTDKPASPIGSDLRESATSRLTCPPPPQITVAPVQFPKMTTKGPNEAERRERLRPCRKATRLIAPDSPVPRDSPLRPAGDFRVETSRPGDAKDPVRAARAVTAGVTRPNPSQSRTNAPALGSPCEPSRRLTYSRRLRCVSTALWFGMALAWCSLAADGKAGDGAWQITGNLVAIEREASGAWRTNSPTTFVVATGVNGWQVRSGFGEGHYSIHGSDGRTVCSVLVDEKASRQFGTKMAAGNVTEGPIPLDTSHYGLLPWLAYASGPYLCANVSRDWATLPAVWTVPLLNPLAQVFRCKIECNDGSPSFPLRVEFFPDLEAIRLIQKGRHPLVAGLDATTRQRYALMAGKYGTNWLGPEAVFEADGVERRSGLTLPTRFRLTWFSYPPGKSRDPVSEMAREQAVYLGLVETVTRIEQFEPFPGLDRPTSVGDYRFQDRAASVEFIRYTIEDGRWPAKTDRRLIELFEDRRVKQRHLRLHRPIVVVGLVVIFFAPLIVWAARRMILRRNAQGRDF